MFRLRKNKIHWINGIWNCFSQKKDISLKPSKIGEYSFLTHGPYDAYFADKDKTTKGG